LCIFCQNFDISHQSNGRQISEDELAGLMLALQNQGCHNINFVTPSHVVPQILSAVEIAVQRGLSIPLVFNTGGYDRIATLKLMDGVIDIYMPDFKFWDSDVAEMTCQAPDYPKVAQKAIIEMYRQVGDLQVDDAGIARRGLLIRHLVLPDGLAGTREIMRFIAQHISPDSYVNIMAQYRPCGRAAEVEGLNSHLLTKEFHKALKVAKREGITRLDQPRRMFRFR
jgi:putative pyruvate formate lyase activating enzyme